MKLILVNQRHGNSRTIVIKGWLKGLLSLCLLGAPVALGYLGYHLALTQSDSNHIVSEKSVEGWQQPSAAQADAQTGLRKNAEQQIEALTQRLATLQARLLRLDALDARLTEVAGLDAAGFDFGQQSPGLGNALFHDASLTDASEFLPAMTRLDIETGPAVGSDGVSYSLDQPGYSLIADINQGIGYLTRYTHAQELQAEQGDIADQRQAEVLIASAAHSTGPDVHFALYKNGRAVDPSSYIHRTHR